MKWYIEWIIYELRIWNQVKLWSSQLWTQFLQLRKEAWKMQDFNGVWTRDLAILVRRSNQLSYDATDVGSWSFVGSNVPVRNESTMKWYMEWIIYELRIWNQVKLWSSQLWTQFLQLRKEAWKIQEFNGVWTREQGFERGLNPNQERPFWEINQSYCEKVIDNACSFFVSWFRSRSEINTFFGVEWILWFVKSVGKNAVTVI